MSSDPKSVLSMGWLIRITVQDRGGAVIDIGRKCFRRLRCSFGQTNPKSVIGYEQSFRFRRPVESTDDATRQALVLSGLARAPAARPGAVSGNPSQGQDESEICDSTESMP